LLGCRHWEFLQKTIASAPIMGADLLVSRGDGPENSGFAGLAGRRWVACRKSLLQRLVYGGLGFALGGIVGRDGDRVTGGKGVFQGFVEVALDRILFQIRVSRGRGCAYAGSRGGIHKLAPAKFEQ